MNRRKSDVVIIGSGLAGLMTAYYLCEKKNVILLTKSKLEKSNSYLAQGGIAAAVSKEDSWQLHYQDTLTAGNYHNEPTTTEFLVQKGSRLLESLSKIEVPFDKNLNQEFSLGMEGAHRIRRILHAGGDATGKALVEAVKKKILSKITVLEEMMAFDLLVENGVCLGVYAKSKDQSISLIKADHTIIATGGIGQLYSATSNCKEATGDGIAMAYRAGATISDMEFIQFHPTLMTDGKTSIGLVSEAVRGEGGRLVTGDGQYVMEGKHPLKDLAPRDVVAREIFKAKQNNQKTYVTISNIANFKERFPSIYSMGMKANCIEAGLIQVEPGAHFIMGGIKVNVNGETSINNLFAIGECANTGVHGANRLASNSLLEAVVFSEQLATTVLNKCSNDDHKALSTARVSISKQVHFPKLKEIQQVMDNYCGIIRNEKDLRQAIEWFNQFQEIIQDPNHLQLSHEEKTICNMLTTGLLIAKASYNRTESRGGHFRSDFPKQMDQSWLGYRTVFHIQGEFREKFIEDHRNSEEIDPLVNKEMSIL